MNNRHWTKIYAGRKMDVYAIYGQHRGDKIYQTASKDGELSGWRYPGNLNEAKIAANNGWR